MDETLGWILAGGLGLVAVCVALGWLRAARILSAVLVGVDVGKRELAGRGEPAPARVLTAAISAAAAEAGVGEALDGALARRGLNTADVIRTAQAAADRLGSSIGPQA